MSIEAITEGLRRIDMLPAGFAPSGSKSPAQTDVSSVVG
jgi:hypothetical protein